MNWKELKIESEQLFEFRQVVGGHALQGAVDSVAEFAEAGVVTVLKHFFLVSFQSLSMRLRWSCRQAEIQELYVTRCCVGDDFFAALAAGFVEDQSDGLAGMGLAYFVEPLERLKS